MVKKIAAYTSPCGSALPVHGKEDTIRLTRTELQRLYVRSYAGCDLHIVIELQATVIVYSTKRLYGRADVHGQQ